MLENNMYVYRYISKVCMYMCLYIYILYPGIYYQVLTNIYFQHKCNPELQKPINPF